jgi:hypothetical protein
MSGRPPNQIAVPIPHGPSPPRQLWELPGTPPQWVRPTIVFEVEYGQRLKEGLRHAALKGLRPNKKPGLIRRSSRRRTALPYWIKSFWIEPWIFGSVPICGGCSFPLKRDQGFSVKRFHPTEGSSPLLPMPWSEGVGDDLGGGTDHNSHATCPRHSITAISRQLHLSRKAIRRALHSSQPPRISVSRSRILSLRRSFL